MNQVEGFPIAENTIYGVDNTQLLKGNANEYSRICSTLN